MTLLSPGIYIQEQDSSAIVPNVSANIAFLAGNFNSGPVDQPYVVTNKKEYEDLFGTPSDRNYNEWFQGYKFFDYANQLVVTRGYESHPKSITDVSHERKTFFNFDGPLVANDPADVTDPDSPYYGKSGRFFRAYVRMDSVNNFTNILHIGDYVSFGDNGANTANGRDIAEVLSITSVETDIGSGFIFYYAIDVYFPEDYTRNSYTEKQFVNKPIYIHSFSHVNGGTQAMSEDFGGDPDNAAIAPGNVYSDIRLSYSYDLIKNSNDFDNKYDQGELHSFLDGAVLKFYSKYADEEKIEIAVAKYEDFASDQWNRHHAIAFSDQTGSGHDIIHHDVFLNDIFEYNPQPNEIGIAIRKGGRGGEIETFLVSLDRDSVDGNNKSNYVETVINENSKFIYVVHNERLNKLPASYLVCDNLGWQDIIVDSSSQEDWGNPVGKNTKPLVLEGGRNPEISLGAMIEAYESIEDKEKYEIDVIIGNEQYTNVAIDIAEKRKDCLAYIGAIYDNCVGKKANEAVNNILNFMKNGYKDHAKPNRTMFAAFFANYFRIYDKFNKKYRWINVAGDMAGIRCEITSSKDAWWVSAGMTRGNIRNISKLAFTPSQPQRDSMYKNGINPIVSFPGTGNLVWGNKTLHPVASSFDRINIRTLFNTLERSMAKAARSQVFEFNDPYTRNAIISMFNPYLATIKAGRGIVDYLVVCDETNNTPDVISRNELRVDIFIRPNYAAEMILLSFTNVGTRSFSDVVGV